MSVVAYRTGRPALSRRPASQISSRDSSALITPLLSTPRTASICARVTGWWYAMIASTSSAAVLRRGGAATPSKRSTAAAAAGAQLAYLPCRVERRGADFVAVEGVKPLWTGEWAQQLWQGGRHTRQTRRGGK